MASIIFTLTVSVQKQTIPKEIMITASAHSSLNVSFLINLIKRHIFLMFLKSGHQRVALARVFFDHQ